MEVGKDEIHPFPLQANKNINLLGDKISTLIATGAKLEIPILVFKN